MRAPRQQRGFTLVELMISLVLFALVVSGILAVAVSMTGGFREQRDATNAEGLVRVPIDYMADVVRQASPGVSNFNIQDADTCSPSALTVTNNPGNPDALDVIYASGGVVTSVKTDFTGNAGVIDVVDSNGFGQNDYVVITNLGQGHFYKITSTTATTLTVQALCGALVLPGGGYVAGSLAIRAAHATFTVAALPLETITALWMDPDAGGAQAAEPLAEGIEDMQIAIGLDGNNDGLGADTGGAGDEWIYNNSGDAAILAWPPAPALGTIRAVRITLVARSANIDTGNALLGQRPTVEDHAAGAPDNYRRRILKTTIEFRSGGVSP
jgi:prepilin-type N-terminal cleavage/methylation domain-containing protein